MIKALLFLLLFFAVRPLMAQDVWLQNHFSPNSGSALSNLETITVLINNNSGVVMPSNTITVNYSINGSATVSQLLSTNLTAGASWNFSFNTKANLSAPGIYVIKVWVVRAGDTNSLNDTLQWTVLNGCPVTMNQPANQQACSGTSTTPFNFTSGTSNVVYSWTNSNPAIGLAASGNGNLPSFNAVNSGTGPAVATITVTPKFETSQTYSYTGNMQTFVVPAGVTSVKVDVKGAQGASAIYNQPGTKPDDLGGKGGRVKAGYPVTPGQTLNIFVGGIGYNGGGTGAGSIAQPAGGGASDIRIGGTALANRVIVAGGGGGGGNNCSTNAEPGGAGGGLTGETGYQCSSQSGTAVGQGGTPSAGGAAGTTPATAGQLGIGGNAGGQGTASGGGGGGYYGGGGAAYGGGGGGNSYTDPLATDVEHTQGFQTGLGEIIITYDMPCANPDIKTFTYTISPAATVIQPADQSVFAGGNTTAINFNSPTTGGYLTYDWTNDTPAIGLAANGTGNIPAFVATNTTNAPLTATITVTPKLISGILDVNQATIGNCIANISQANLAQSFKAVANSIVGAGILLNSFGGNGTITVSLWDKLPNAGGVQLATGTVASSPNSWADVYWSPVSVTPGTTYYLVLSGTNVNNCVAGSNSNPYPDGQVYANSGYQSFPTFDFAFRTYGPGSASCTGTPQTFKITVKALKPGANGIIYVKKGSNGNGDSWASPISELADALIGAKSLNVATPGKVKQIWVAGGVYKPMYNPADNAFGIPAGRNNTFLLVKDVQVYGGFAGTETALVQRDLSIVANQTVLSGDYNGDDVLSGYGATLNLTGNAENAYQVVMAAGDAGTALLDGFTISGGNANGGNLPQINAQQFLVGSWGGGMYASNSPTLAVNKLRFVANKASTGGGMAINGSGTAPQMQALVFAQNYAEQSGGALYSAQNMNLTNCAFTGNKSADLAGALLKAGGILLADRCFFAGNASANSGGAIYDQSGQGNTYINTVFVANQSGNKGGGLFVGNIFNTRTNNFINCTFSGNTATQGSATVEWTSATTTFQHQMAFVNSIVNDGENAVGAGGEVKAYLKNTLLKQSAAVSANVILQGNSASLLNMDPLFTDADGADNLLGTADDNLTLKSTSLAIGAGDNGLYTGNINTDKDLSGNMRLTGTQIDLGAYEALVQAQTITATNHTKTYGDAAFEPGATASSGLNVTYASADNSIAEAFQDAADGNKWKLNIKKAGTVSITASQPGNGAFSPAADAVFSLLINQRPVTVSIKSTAVLNKVYDAGTAVTIQSTDLTMASGDVINNDDVQLNLNSGAAQYDTPNAGTGKTITLPITHVLLTGLQAGNYKVANISDLSNSTASVTPKPLTITANNFSKVFNGFGYSGGNGVSYGAFALGEDPTVLSGTLTYGGTSQGAISTGNYTIVPGGLSSANYAISYTNGQLVISLNNVNILTFNSQAAGSLVNKTYGDADLNASANASSGLPASYQSSNSLVATVNASGQVSLLGTGTATITVSQAGDTNYGPATPVTFQVQVARKTLMVTANDFSKTYNAVAYAGGNGVSYNGFVNGETAAVLGGAIGYNGSSQGAVNTGNYTIIPGGLTSANYNFDYRNGTLSIVPSGANVITFNNQVTGATLLLTYGNPVVDASAVASSGLAVSYASSNPAVAQVNASGQVQLLAAGTATITASQPGDGNHTAATQVSFTISIQQKALTVTANNFNKTYNAMAYTGGNGVSYNGFVNGENEQALQGTLTYIGTAVGAKDVGSYFISPTGYTSGNYAITYQDGSLTITKASLTITAQAKSKVYGDADPALTYATSGLVGTDAITGALSRVVGENAGTYAIGQGTINAGANYSISYVPASFNIGTKTLTISAQAKSKVYGDADPALTYTTSGLVGTDVVTGALSRVVGENAGAYAIGQGTLNAGANYSISYVPASFNIGTKTLTITAQAKSKVYGDADPVLTYTASGLIGTDAITGALTRAIGESAGTYAIGQGTINAGANYSISYVPASFNIGTKTLSITAQAKSKVYGDADPALTYTTSGLVGTDAITGALSRAIGESAGTYAIGQGTLNAGGNYSISYVPASFNISSKTLSITAQAKSKVYGDADPALTYTASGLVGSDAITGALSRAIGENAGTYAIGLGTLNAGANYSISYLSANLTITKAPLLVTANNVAMCEGNNLPGFGVAYSGFKNGDTENSLSTKPTVGSVANSNSPAGNYLLNPGGAVGGNYTISYATGNLTINALPVVGITSSKGLSISKGETLNLLATGGGNYSWSMANGIISGQNSSMLTIRPGQTTTYAVTVTNGNGCSRSANITIEVRDDFEAVKANNILTPNGDGVNDLWVVENIDAYPNNTVQIFDRAGRMLFSKKGYNNTWDGMVNGQVLAEGTYYYIIDFGTGKLRKKGFITLVLQQ